VLRPDRRTRRVFAGVLVTVTALALIWPASFAAGHSSTSATRSAGDVAAKHKSRQPTVHGLGVRPLESKHTTKPPKSLQRLNVDHANRGIADAGRGLRAPAVAAVTPPAAVQATSSGAPAATSFGAFDGLNQTTSGAEPPDPWVAVGPNDIVQTTNAGATQGGALLRFTNRKGAATAGNVSMYDFFDFGTWSHKIDGIGDPRWTYDAKHNRWLGITLAWHCDTDGAGTNDDSIGYVWGAISLTDDPTGDYYQFYLDYHNYLPDFPGLGTSADKFAITANEYVMNDTTDCTSGMPYDSGSIFSFDWAEMLTYPAAPDFTYELDASWFSLRAGLSPTGSSNTMFITGEKLLASDTTSDVVYMTLTGTNKAGGQTLSAEQDLTALGVVPPFVDPPVPVQPGGALDANIIDRRPTDAVWQDNVLTFASTTGCDPAGGAAGENRNCARVTQINTSTATPTRVQDMLVATTAKDTWYPGVGVSQSGILHVVYTESSSSQGMTSEDRYQLPSDAKQTLSAPVTLASGAALNYPGDRWGDFVGVAQDPRDTNAVWQGNEYTASPGNWATKVSELQTDGAVFFPIAPVRVLDSRNTGKFVSGSPKNIKIAGVGGIPANAVAITGNVTVTNQQTAGFVSVTRLPASNPQTSTLNFPVHDNRANNVTSPLSTDGNVSITFKSSTAGKTADVILDVTGYFLNGNVGSTYKPLAPVRVLETRAITGQIGPQGPIHVSTNTEFQVAGVKTVPANAVAVTGNLTVVNQTAAGFITLSTAPPATSPQTSTINFPVGDIRANGVTVKLSATGSLWFVYKSTVSGATIQVLFDVTGYYVNDLTGARFVPMAPGRRMDTRFPAPPQGLTGAFVSGTPRTLVIEPYQGVPVNATAITGNLTVVGSTRGGLVSMTQATPPAGTPPTTSTLNFPKGDIRANGVTGPLTDPAGTIGLLYVGAGGTTHMILDVTGYFR
jgi:hypothetical protein